LLYNHTHIHLLKNPDGWEHKMTLITINAKWQLKQVKRLMRQIQAKSLNKKLIQSLNQAAREVEKKAETIVAKDMSMKAPKVKKGIFIRYRANETRLQATIRGSGKPAPLKFFKGVKEKTHTGTMVEVWGQKTMYEGAFVKGGNFPDRTELKMGGNVLYRTGKVATKGKRKGKKNSGVTNEIGFPIAQSMNKSEISNTLVFYGQEQILEKLKHNMGKLIGK